MRKITVNENQISELYGAFWREEKQRKNGARFVRKTCITGTLPRSMNTRVTSFRIKSHQRLKLIQTLRARRY